METRQLQELLLEAMPLWHFYIFKPFKRQLDQGVSLGMYHCIQHIRQHNGTVTMSRLARESRCPKQQMTKLISRLIECRFAERIPDPADRRIVRIRLTDEGLQYAEKFLSEDAAYFHKLLDGLTPEDKDALGGALETFNRILPSLLGDGTDTTN